MLFQGCWEAISTLEDIKSKILSVPCNMDLLSKKDEMGNPER